MLFCFLFCFCDFFDFFFGWIYSNLEYLDYITNPTEWENRIFSTQLQYDFFSVFFFVSKRKKIGKEEYQAQLTRWGFFCISEAAPAKRITRGSDWELRVNSFWEGRRGGGKWSGRNGTKKINCIELYFGNQNRSRQNLIWIGYKGKVHFCSFYRLRLVIFLFCGYQTTKTAFFTCVMNSHRNASRIITTDCGLFNLQRKRTRTKLSRIPLLCPSNECDKSQLILRIHWQMNRIIWVTVRSP